MASRCVFRGFVIAGAVFAALSASGVASATYEFLVAAQGAKQGNFIADSNAGIVGLAYYNEVVNTGASVSTGAASGKLTYGTRDNHQGLGPLVSTILRSSIYERSDKDGNVHFQLPIYWRYDRSGQAAERHRE